MSEKPLHVMMNKKDLERYKRLAADRSMTLRELVRTALNAEWDRWHELNNSDKLSPGEDPAVASMQRQILTYGERLARIETILEAQTKS